MDVRGATVSDLDVVLALLRAQYEEHAIVVPQLTLTEAVRAMTLHPSRGTILLADDAKIVGLAVLAYMWTLEHGGRVAWLDELFVVPEQRGRGIGHILLQHALVIAEEMGCRVVQLEVELGHERAEHLYQRAGFTSVRRRRWIRSLTDAQGQCAVSQALGGRPHGR